MGFDLESALGGLAKDFSSFLPNSILEETEAGLVTPKIRLNSEPEFLPDELSGGEMVVSYIDGGSVPVVDFGPLLVELNRVVAVRYNALEMQPNPTAWMYLSLTTLKDHKVETKTYPIIGDAPGDLVPFNIGVNEFTYGMRLSGRARRAGELSAACHETRQADAVVLDGGLGHGGDPSEIKGLSEMAECAKKEGVGVCGFVKRTTLTVKGFPVTYFADEVAKKAGRDHYIAKVGEATRALTPYGADLLNHLYAAKLSSRAFKPYLIEAFPSESLEVLLWNLRVNSTSVGSPGYPLGLVSADRYAGIDYGSEGKIVKLRLASILGGSPILGEASSHDLLDALSGRW